MNKVYWNSNYFEVMEIGKISLGRMMPTLLSTNF